jgi:hypothetical protein
MTPFHVGEDVRPHRVCEEIADASPWDDADPSCAPEADLAHYLRRLFLPLRRAGGIMTVGVADTTAENIAWLRAAYGRVRFVEVPKAALIAEIDYRFHRRLTDEATFSLERAAPALSARRIIAPVQGMALSLAGAMLAVALFVWPATATFALVAAMSTVFWISVLFRTLLALLGANATRNATSEAADDLLPAYTIIVPLYREANMVAQLSSSMSALDYPGIR